MKTPDETQANKIPPQIMQDLTMRLGNLKQALLDKDPEMPNHLRESHRLLITYPETTHLLDDDEVADLISAAQEYTKVKVVADVAKSSGRGKKKEVNAALDL
jgi:hypothetical protein